MQTLLHLGPGVVFPSLCSYLKTLFRSLMSVKCMHCMELYNNSKLILSWKLSVVDGSANEMKTCYGKIH